MDMQAIFSRAMAAHGKASIEKDREAKFFGRHYPSRGFYIVFKLSPDIYLHKDGEARQGVKQPDGSYAFWNTKEEAETFLNDWLIKINRED